MIMNILNYRLFPLLFVISISILPMLGKFGITLFSNTFSVWILDFLVLANVIYYYKYYCTSKKLKDYQWAKFYLIWILICIIRGIFVAENYWEYKALIGSSLCLLLPVFLFIFQSPTILKQTLYIWLKYALPLFLCVGIWIIPIDSYHFIISPILLLGCFLPILPKRWKLLFGILLIVMLVGELGARAQIMKATAVLGLAIVFYFRNHIKKLWFKIVHILFYILPIILLILGIFGIFNIFEANKEKNQGKYVSTKEINGQKVIVDASVDTRTFIYEEVITSARKHNYIIFGRTPARGNDSKTFGALMAEELKTGKYERSMNEVCHPNVFTWTGLVGLIAWCMIYLRGSYLALYKSRNIYLKIIGIFIAFRFFLGWIEDVNNFNISGISIWMIIAMGYSQYFRSMSNHEFKNWLIQCLPFKNI